MPAAALKPTLENMVSDGGGLGEHEAALWESSGLGRNRQPLPSIKVPRELLRSFPHSKRVGSYLVGKMINKGSFAKVMEGLHIGTGEKVGGFSKIIQIREGEHIPDMITHSTHDYTVLTSTLKIIIHRRT